MKNIVLLAVALLFMGCNGSSVDRTVREFMGRELLFSDSVEFLVNGTQCTREYFDKAAFKIINYIDTSGCEECKLHFFDWGKLQRALDTLSVDVKVCFIVWSKDIDNVLKLSRIHRFNYPLLYDNSGIFQRQNNLPLISGFKTCLVDSNNRVVGVGSPLYNEALLELYLKHFTK